MAIEQARPFLKWAGGKAALVPQLLERIPATWNRKTDLYVEPFLGGGAMFFALQPKLAILNDSNPGLAALYGKVQGDAGALSSTLDRLVALYALNPEAVYYDVRTAYNAEYTKTRWSTQQCARLLFLNKTCFNGLYRVNANGEFNAPWGRNPKAGFPTLEHLQCCSAVLRGAVVGAGDFTLLDGLVALKGALIYCDPPYVPVSKTANFTDYTAGGFTYTDQLRLVIQAAYWRDDGAHVILSQAADENLVDQYRRVGFRADLVQAKRNINSKGAGRGAVGEYIIY